MLSHRNKICPPCWHNFQPAGRVSTVRVTEDRGMQGGKTWTPVRENPRSVRGGTLPQSQRCYPFPSSQQNRAYPHTCLWMKYTCGKLKSWFLGRLTPGLASAGGT